MLLGQELFLAGAACVMWSTRSLTPVNPSKTVQGPSYLKFFFRGKTLDAKVLNLENGEKAGLVKAIL